MTSTSGGQPYTATTWTATIDWEHRHRITSMVNTTHMLAQDGSGLTDCVQRPDIAPDGTTYPAPQLTRGEELICPACAERDS